MCSCQESLPHLYWVVMLYNTFCYLSLFQCKSDQFNATGNRNNPPISKSLAREKTLKNHFFSLIFSIIHFFSKREINCKVHIFRFSSMKEFIHDTFGFNLPIIFLHYKGGWKRKCDWAFCPFYLLLRTHSQKHQPPGVQHKTI